MSRPRRVRPIRQMTPTECGLVSALMVMRHHGCRESLVGLRQEWEPGRDGLTLRHLVGLLQSRGFDAQAYRCGTGRLVELPTPFIAFWDANHFVVVEQVDGDRYTIVDPAADRRRISGDELREHYSGAVVTATPTAAVDPDRNRAPWVWRPFLPHLLAAPKMLVGAVVASLLVYAASLGVPLLTQYAIDTSTAGHDLVGGPTFWLLFVAAGLIYGMFIAGQVVTTTGLTVALGRGIMHSTFRHLLRLPYTYFQIRSSGEIFYRLNTINGLRDLLAAKVVTGLLDVGMIVVVLGYMASRNLLLTGVAVAFFGAIILVLAGTNRRVERALDVEMTEFGATTSQQIEAVTSIEALRLAGREQAFFDTWSERYERGLGALRRRSLLQGSVSAGVTALQVVAPLVILTVGLGLVARGVLSLGEAVAFQTLSATFFGLAQGLFSSYTQYLVATAYLDRLVDITWTPAEAWPMDGSTERLGGRIEVEGVDFAYTRTARTVLHGVSFTVNPGEKLAIVGASGSGKTTIGNLLTGLHRPTAGTIRYDGRTLADLDRDSFFDAVAAVPQEIHLQSATILDNIVMGRDYDTLDEVVYAASAAQIHDEIMAMPMGYLTPITDAGQNLSGGQRQRVALARALFKRPAILVLDEATSALDILNESRIADHLARERCTRVVIAHRLSTIVDADRIIVVDAGRIVQTGTHADLFHVEGPYRELFLRQRDVLFAVTGSTAVDHVDVALAGAVEPA